MNIRLVLLRLAPLIFFGLLWVVRPNFRLNGEFSNKAKDYVVVWFGSVWIPHRFSAITLKCRHWFQYKFSRQRRWTWTGDFKCREVKTGFCRNINANRFFGDSHWLDIWSNHFCPSMGLNGGSVATDSEWKQFSYLSVCSRLFFLYIIWNT